MRTPSRLVTLCVETCCVFVVAYSSNMASIALKNERIRALDELQEMFSTSLDPEVVKLILTESDFDVNAALEQLFTLSSGSTKTESTHTTVPQRTTAALDDFDYQQPQSGTSTIPSSMDSRMDVLDGGPVLSDSKTQIKLGRDLDTRTAPGRSRLPINREGRSPRSIHMEGSTDPGVDSGDNSRDSAPCRSREAPTSGRGEYRGTFGKFHTAVSDGMSKPSEWTSHDIGDELQRRQLDKNEPSNHTASKYTVKNLSKSSANSNSSKSYTKDLARGKSDTEQLMHGKNDSSEVEELHGNVQGKKELAVATKVSENPPQIQRRVFAPRFGSPHWRPPGPNGRGILGDMPRHYMTHNMPGLPAHNSRGTSILSQRPPLLVQQLNQNSYGPGSRPNIRHPLAKLLIIMRGLPGSGKSTLAWRLKRNGVILSTDDYFMGNGKYEFDPTQLGQAHEWTQSKAREVMEKGITPLIIDNTNTQAWEMKPYVSMGLRHGYTIIFREPDTPWKFNIKELARRNQHGVGFQIISRMLNRYQRHVTVEEVMNSNRETTAGFPKEAPNPKSQTSGAGASSTTSSRATETHRGGPETEGLPRNMKAEKIPSFNPENVTFTDRSTEPVPTSRMIDDSDDDVIVEPSDVSEHEPIVHQSDSLSRPLVGGPHGVEAISGPGRNSQKGNGSYVPSHALEKVNLEETAVEAERREVTAVERSPRASAEPAANASGAAEQKLGMAGGLEFLKTCFPDTDCSILESVLLSSDGDVVKTVEIILASKDYVGPQPLPTVVEETSDSIPRNEASPPRNTEDDARGLGSISDVSRPGCSGVPDFPDSFTYAGASGHPAAGRMGCRPTNQLGDIPRKSPEAGPSNAPSVGPPGVQVPGMTHSQGAAFREAPISCTPQEKQGGVDASSCFQLSLEPAVAFHLMEIFGPVTETSLTDDLSPEDLVVSVDSSFAKLLYAEWEKSVQTKTDASGATKTRTSAQPRKFRRLVSDKEASPSWQPSGPERGTKQLKTEQFRSIMDEELAIELSNAKRDDKTEPVSKDIATVLKQRKLHAMFPGVDPVALDDIFAANGSELGPTVEMVKASFGLPAAERPTVVVPSAFVKPEGERKKQITAEKPDLQPSATEDRSLRLEETSSGSSASFQALQDPDYQDFRAEASVHYRLRDECFKKAALAFSKKQGELAQLYARQGHEHTEKIREANERAAVMILQQKNANRNVNEIDLHGLHVAEALRVLEQMLAAWKPGGPRPSPKVITVVTGRGIHSRGGKARIKPAVMDYLRRNHYRFVELNAGLLQVTLY